MDEQITRFEIFGLVFGAAVGAILPCFFWLFSGQPDLTQWLFWGAPLKSFLWVTAFIGAVVGVCFGHAIRQRKPRN